MKHTKRFKVTGVITVAFSHAPDPEDIIDVLQDQLNDEISYIVEDHETHYEPLEPTGPDDETIDVTIPFANIEFTLTEDTP